MFESFVAEVKVEKRKGCGLRRLLPAFCSHALSLEFAAQVTAPSCLESCVHLSGEGETERGSAKECDAEINGIVAVHEFLKSSQTKPNPPPKVA